MPPTEAAWNEAIEEINQANRIGVVGHVRPDGDAIGSMVAIALAARAAGKDAVASFGKPFILGDEFRFLDHSVLVPPEEFPTDLDLAIVCDTGVLDRVGSVGPAVLSARRLLVIDHHLTPGTIGDVRVVDPSAAATTQLVFEFLNRLGWMITGRSLRRSIPVWSPTPAGSSTRRPVRRSIAWPLISSTRALNRRPLGRPSMKRPHSATSLWFHAFSVALNSTRKWGWCGRSFASRTSAMRASRGRLPIN